MMRILLVSAVLSGIAVNCTGMAADIAVRMPVKAKKIVPRYDWTGPYVGFHFGYGGGSLGANTNPLPAQGVFFPATTTGLIGGYQIGYNFQAASGLVLGVEGDATFISNRVRPIFVPYSTTFNYFASARARVGYAYGALLPYLTAGLAWGSTLVNINDESGEPIATRSLTHLGWIAGIGVEFPLTGKWTGRYEYDYISLGSKTYSLDLPTMPWVTVDPRVHVVKLGLNYRFWDHPQVSPIYVKAPQPVWPTDPGWSIHGQTTFIQQAYPSFRSPYEGEHSLPGKGQGRETWTATAFIGRALWDGGELYFNPELDQGFGLNTTLGLAGFANGEAQKGGAPYPRFRAQRYFLRQTFGLGGGQEAVEDAANQIAGKRDIDRITLTVGRFAIGDFFDANGYAHDPRADFLNWSLWASAAYDFPADLPGFTRGAVVELNRKSWALRAGLVQVPSEPNSDTLVFKTGGAVLEWEGRYSIFGQSGKLRVGGFANRGNTGNYREALAIAASDPSVDINDVMAAIRRQRPKYGFYANMEQAVGKDLGVFARGSWNDGSNEILSFTDIDWSVTGGLSIGGSSWGREADRIGIGGAVNGLSAAHRDFLAAGGLGLLIGDGTINYRPESILETYYAYKLNPATTLAFDYQFIANPAHNTDRGPVSVFAFRGHAEF